MSLPNWKSIPVCIRRSRRKLYNLVATEFSLISYESLDVSVRRSNRKLYNYVASQLDLNTWDELDVPLRRSTHLLYNYVKGCSSTQTLTVSVTDESSVAISGASVVIGETSKSTGDDGKVTFQLSYGDYEATVSAEGYVTATEELAFRSNHKNFSVTLEAAATTDTLTLTIDDGTDPISGASVTIGETTETTNASGVATFTLEYDTYSASISKEGYTTKSESITFDSTHKNFTVSLEAASTTGTVTVTCQDSEENPIDRASVELYLGEYDTPTYEQVATGSSNENGVCSLLLVDEEADDPRQIPFGTYTLYASHMGPFIEYKDNAFVVDGDETATITLTEQ